MKRFVLALALAGGLLVPVVGSSAQDAAVVSASNMSALNEITMVPLAGVVACDWSPEGTQIAASGLDGVVTVDVLDGAAAPVPLSSQPVPATEVVYTSDGRDLVLANGDQIRVWERNPQRLRLTIPGHAPVAVSADSTLVAFTDGGLQVQVASLADGAARLAIEGHLDVVTDLGFSPTGQYLVSSSLDNLLRIWNLSNGDQMRFQRSRGRAQLALDVNRFSSVVASGTRGGIARVLNVVVMTESAYNLRPREDVVDVEFSPDGLLLALVGGNNLYLWTTNSREAPVVVSLSTPASCVAFNPEGSRLLVGAEDGLHIFAPAA
ncbi:MAG TPA: hypothetical protein VER79_07235 [Candidatus Limnocylindrales bacterium]|nr:hypothetical protein [Candidatus Limnocylindrales bacterium]